MFDTKLIKQLSEMSGVSGYENNVGEFVISLFSKYCDNVTRDNMGNVIGVKKSKSPKAKKLMIEAHMDEIGLMITNIDDNGFLNFTTVGGIDARILLANEVVVHGNKDLFGIIGAKPPHVLTEEERTKTVPADKLYIDIGMDKQNAQKYVSIGDVVTFKNKFLELKNGLISTKSQDDRTSVAILVSVMKKLCNVESPFDLYFVASVQEEVGLRGAKTAAYGINPDMAIVIDVCHASTPDSGSDGVYDFGSGAIITKGPNIHPKMLKRVLEALDDNGIGYQIDIEGGDTGTDAWAVQVARCGVPTVLFSVPLRYMHTPVETVSTGDLSVIVNSICAFCSISDETEDFLCY